MRQRSAPSRSVSGPLSATGFAPVAGLAVMFVLSAGCVTSAPQTPPGDEMVAKLGALGIEGKTYRNDLAQVAYITVRAVHQVDDDFLIEDLHGHLTYVNGATLNPRWEYYGLPKGFDEPPDYTPSAIVGLSDGKLFVISRLNGTVDLESHRVNLLPSAKPAATDSTIYVPTYPTPAGNKSVYAVSLASGYKGWGWRTDDDVRANTAKGGPLGGDTFYFATTGGSIYAFPTSLASDSAPEPAWTAHAKSPVYRDLAVEGDDLAVVTSDGRLVLYDRITGHVRWEAYPNSGERAESSAQFSASHVFYRVAGELRAYARDGSGGMAWACKGGRRYVGRRGNRVIVQGDGGKVMSIDGGTGKVVATVSLPGVSFPPQVAADSTFYAVSRHGMLVSVEQGW